MRFTASAGIFTKRKSMHIVSAGNNTFRLVTPIGEAVAVLQYESNLFKKCEINAGKKILLENTATGIWKSYAEEGSTKKQWAELKVSTASTISVKITGQKSKYRFKRTGGWKARFILLNKDGEELMALLPQINWQKQTYGFVLQINDEFEQECTPVLILHTLHCACCSLNMLNGAVPVLINV
jgi:hypothetical protein